MTFYAQLSRYYDGLFAPEQGDMDFVLSLLQGKTRLLDVGCGTGNNTEFFSEKGRAVTGIDSEAAMIGVALKKHIQPGISYIHTDMMNIDERFGFSAFDAVTCFGNTLAHLPSRGAVSAFCGKSSYVLEPEGMLIVQLLNYDRIIAKNIRELPPLESDEAVLKRRYEHRDGRMLFIVELTDKTTGAVLENSTELYPIGRYQVADILDIAGFRNISWYGSAQGAPLTEDSFAIMAVCRR